MNEIFSFMISLFLRCLIISIPIIMAIAVLVAIIFILSAVIDFIIDITDEIAYKIKEWKEHRENLKRNKKVWGDLWKK